MVAFAPVVGVDEQVRILTAGAVDTISEADLRRKLNAPGEIDPIRTVRGVGYSLENV